MAFSGIAVTEALRLQSPQLFWRALRLQRKSTVKARLATKATSQKTSGHSIIQQETLLCSYPAKATYPSFRTGRNVYLGSFVVKRIVAVSGRTTISTLVFL